MQNLFPLDDAQIIAVADPTDSFSLENFYFKGMGGRLPVKAEIEKHYAHKTPNFRCEDYVDFRQMTEKEKTSTPSSSPHQTTSMPTPPSWLGERASMSIAKNHSLITSGRPDTSQKSPPRQATPPISAARGTPHSAPARPSITSKTEPSTRSKRSTSGSGPNAGIPA